MLELLQTVGGTLLRHGVSAIGVWLVSKGYLDAGAAASLVEYLTGGALIVLAGVLSYVKGKKA
jgi:energy-converting hydrogenase Eha subunit C